MSGSLHTSYLSAHSAVELAVPYSRDEHVRSVGRKLITWPLLPLNEVEQTFFSWRASLDASVKQQLREFFRVFRQSLDN